jgi:hypothetical protein
MPEISDERLVELAKTFPLIHPDKSGEYRIVDLSPHDMKTLRNTSCIWSPKLGSAVAIGAEQRRVHFYVSCGYHGLFKPSVAEVLSQAPIDDLERSGFDAFYIDDHVEILRSGGFQKATACFVRLWKKNS